MLLIMKQVHVRRVIHIVTKLEGKSELKLSIYIYIFIRTLTNLFKRIVQKVMFVSSYSGLSLSLARSSGFCTSVVEHGLHCVKY